MGLGRCPNGAMWMLFRLANSQIAYYHMMIDHGRSHRLVAPKFRRFYKMQVNINVNFKSSTVAIFRNKGDSSVSVRWISSLNVLKLRRGFRVSTDYFDHQYWELGKTPTSDSSKVPLILKGHPVNSRINEIGLNNVVTFKKL